MKKILSVLFFAAWCISCSKSSDTNNNNANGACSPNSNVCFQLNGNTVAFTGNWVDLVGSKVAIKADNATVGFNMDIGTKMEVKTYTIDNGSLWSGNSRISYTDKATGKNYTAISGTLNITSVAGNKLTGNFTAVFKDNSNSSTVNITNGNIVSVGQ